MSSVSRTQAIVIATLAGAIGFGAAMLMNNMSGKKEETNEMTDTVKGEAPAPVLDMPVIDFQRFFERSENADAYIQECVKVAEAFHKYGIVLVKDPRVIEDDNNTFLNMMEGYFEGSDGTRDARPEYHYQVGVTPDHTERPRNHCGVVGSMGPDDKPLSPCPPELDPKWRFFWRVGPVPQKTQFPALNAEAVIPPEIPEWKGVMDMWGGKMMDALFVLAEMCSVGFGMQPDMFTSRMHYGPHLLAPTGSNLNRFGADGTVLAGFHQDLNFMTIHGKSRFPGLNIWTREGRKSGVKIPDGCLLVQAGKQLEYLTGGHVLAGFHEVVVNSATVKVIDERKADNKSLWRVSSTCFGHIQSDVELRPLGPFLNENTISKFPPTLAGFQVRDELEAIALAKSSNTQ
jgi:isopenicillin N synthase-like dioxygenase